MDARLLRRRLSYLQRRFRRPLAALLAFIAVIGALSILRPPPADSISVQIAARDLPAGTALTPDDLTATDIPAPQVPPGALTDVSASAGRTLSAPMLAGEVLTTSRLTESAVSSEMGTYAVPIRLADADAAALLSPGMVIDIVRDLRGQADVLAEGVRVLTVPRHPATNSFASSSNARPGSLILVAADRTTAVRLAAAGTNGELAAIVR